MVFILRQTIKPTEKNKTTGRKSEKDKSDENSRYFSSLGN